MPSVDLTDEEWRTILFVLMKTPHLPITVEGAHALAMKIGEQVRKQSETTSDIVSRMKDKRQ